VLGFVFVDVDGALEFGLGEVAGEGGGIVGLTAGDLSGAGEDFV